MCNINNKISGRQPQICVEVVQRFRDWLRLHVQGPVKQKIDEKVPYCAGAQAERRSAHRTGGHLFVSFCLTEPSAAP